MSTIALSVSLGRYARFLLRSGFPRALLTDPLTHLAIFSPGAEDPHFVNEFRWDGRVSFFPLIDEPIGRALWERALWKVCQMSLPHRGLFLAAMQMHHTAYRTFRPAHYRQVLAALRPDLLVVASVGFSTTRDVPLIREARAAGVQTLYAVHSWDNLTGMKGLMLERPDVLAVWNDIMKEQAIQRYHYVPEQVEVIGALQFDVYASPSTFLPREEFLHRLQLDPSRPVVTLATGMPQIDSGFFIERIAQAVRQKRFVGNPQFLCRPHPLQSFQYEQFESIPDLRFDRFHRVSRVLGWDPTLEESTHIANLLRHSAVVVNIASTITLEACLVDTPVVNVAFDGAHPEVFERNIHHDHWQRHFRVVRDTGATWVAQDEESLIAGINRFLENPRYLEEERRRLVRFVCGPCDGLAHQRLAQLARRLAGGS